MSSRSKQPTAARGQQNVLEEPEQRRAREQRAKNLPLGVGMVVAAKRSASTELKADVASAISHAAISNKTRPRVDRRPLRRIFSDGDREELRGCGLVDESALIRLEHACAMAQAQGWFKKGVRRPERGQLADSLDRIEQLAKQLHPALAGAPGTNAIDIWTAADVEVELEDFLSALAAVQRGASKLAKSLRSSRYKVSGERPVTPIKLIARVVGPVVNGEYQGRTFQRVVDICYAAMGADETQLPSRRTIAKAVRIAT